MFNEIGVPDGAILLPTYNLRVYDKDKHKLILDRYIASKSIAKELYEEQVNIYHNLDRRVVINLYDIDKCTNIEYYDSDDNI